MNEIDRNIKNEMNREIETHREKKGLNRQNEMNREIEAHEGNDTRFAFLIAADNECRRYSNTKDNRKG